MTRFLVIVTLFACAIGLTILKSRVAADSFAIGPPTSGMLADSGDHYFCITNLVAGSVTPARDAMSYLDNRTDMIDFEQSCTAATDVVFTSVNLGTFRGQWSCVVSKPGNICDRAAVDIDETVITNNGANFANNLSKTLMHEIGHSVGLTHYAGDPTENPQITPTANDDCMISGAVNGSTGWYRYITHRKDHIDNAY